MTTPKMGSLVRNFRRVLPLMRDERVPAGLKIAAGAMAVLIISPLDVFGDIPVLGLFDDAVLLTLLAMVFVMLATRATQRVVSERVAAAANPPPPAAGVMQLPRAHPVRKAER